jgi:hypothetical protein
LKKAQLDKEAGEQRGQNMSQAAQAYKLFSDDKTPVDVALMLNLRHAEVTEFYREYWKMCSRCSITESIRNNPERYRSLFYNMPSVIDCYNTNTQDYAASYMYGGQIQQQRQYSSLDYNTEANIDMIVDEAEKLFNKAVKDCIKKLLLIALLANHPHHYHYRLKKN